MSKTRKNVRTYCEEDESTEDFDGFDVKEENKLDKILREQRRKKRELEDDPDED